MDLGGGMLCTLCKDGCQCDGRGGAGDFVNCKCEDDCTCGECHAPAVLEEQSL